MPLIVRRHLVRVVAAVVFMAAAAAAGAAPAPKPTKTTFTVSGEVSGLYPGLMASLTLTVSNPERYDVTITALSIQVADASAQCVGGNVVVGAVQLPDVVRARRSGAAIAPVGLVADAADACQGATFPLTYTATAVKR